MKRVLTLLVVLSMICTLVPSAFAFNVDEDSLLRIKLDTIEGGLADAKEVTVIIENVTEDKTLAGDITIQAPEGWTLGATTGTYTVAAKETTTVSFPVESTKAVAFNVYNFTMRVKDNSLGEVLNATMPLGFTNVVKQTQELDVAAFDGDMTSWADAYPVYINAPQYSNHLRDWYDSDAAGMMFTKWDENYLYILMNVYDDALVQKVKDDSIWSNDNIQVSIDTLNDDTSNSYGSDDYEIGMALTTEGIQMWSWQAADASAEKSGNWDASMTTLVRDDERRITRYILKLPKDHCAPLDLKEGTAFGMNFVVNDADISSRESAEQLTSGTADGKNPKMYKTFKLVGEAPAANLADIETYKLPIELKIDNTVDFATFNGTSKSANRTYLFDDIARHWARKDVEEMAKRGIVDGVAPKTFEPDREITRAEFIALLAKAGIAPSEYKGGLSDVKADDWFAGYIQTGIDAKVIPAEMTADGSYKPEDPIKREEMATMVVNMYAYKTGSALPAGTSSFSDESEFSAWTVDAINAASKAGIVNGVGDGRFDAKASATRAEAVVIVKRLLSQL